MKIVISTFPSRRIASDIGKKMVRARLAACVSTVPVQSIYWWKGEVEDANEVMALFKTTPRKSKPLMREIERLHPYDVPEVIELEVNRVARKYLGWAEECLSGPRVSRKDRAGRAPR
jgi:periplasmic divalent cation tolerance protein